MNLFRDYLQIRKIAVYKVTLVKFGVKSGVDKIKARMIDRDLIMYI